MDQSINLKNYNMKARKLTRGYFCKIYPEMAKKRKSDNYDFEICFNDWKRSRQNTL